MEDTTVNTHTETTTRPAGSDRDAQRRQALINGLRDLAQFLDEHPAVPFEYADLLYHVRAGDDEQGITRLHELADLLGVEVADTLGGPVSENTTHFEATRKFGPVTYRASYIRRQAMADHAALMSYSKSVRGEGCAA
jgi:hypothetical protein